MTRQSFEFGRLLTAGDPRAWVLVVLATLIAWSFWMYRRDVRGLSRPVRYLLISLRMATWFVVLILLCEPRLRSESFVERPSRVAVAIDSSLSMGLPPAEEAISEGFKSRFDEARAALEKLPSLERLTQVQELIGYQVGSITKKLWDLPSGKAAGETPLPIPEQAADDQSRLAEGLASILREHRGMPLAGILFVTDGQDTTGSSFEESIRVAREARVPIFAVGVGSPTAPANVRLSELRVPTRAFLGDEIKGEAFVQGTGLAGKHVTVEVLLRSAQQNTDPVLLEVQDVPLPPDESPVPVAFKYLPRETGAWQIVARATTVPGEVRSDDNSATANVDVIDQKTKVLLLAGGPTREYRFLRNLLYRDSSIDVSVYLQSSGREGAQEADERLKSLPATREDLFRFDAVIAIDPDWSALTAEQLEIWDEWVAEQAGGLILLAGPVHTPRLARSRDASPILDLYPVTLKEVFTSDFDAGRFGDPWPVEFTRDGELADYLHLAEEGSEGSADWRNFSGVYWCYPVTNIKPAATVLAQFRDPRSADGARDRPLIVRQFYGAGRVLYLGTGEWWRLRQLGEAYYDRFWIRLIREMSQGRLLRGSSRAFLMVDGDQFPIGTQLTVRAQVFGADYRPIASSVIPLAVVDPAGPSTNVELKRSTGPQALYEAVIPLSVPGEYRLELLVPGTTEVVQRRIRAEIPERELAEVTMNRSLLETLANQTGGKLLTRDELDRLPELIEDRTEVSVVSEEPANLWDNGWLMGVAVLLACAEWLIRKLNYLA